MNISLLSFRRRSSQSLNKNDGKQETVWNEVLSHPSALVNPHWKGVLESLIRWGEGGADGPPEKINFIEYMDPARIISGDP